MTDIIIQNLFRNIDITSLNTAQKILTFYKLVIELERTKEPDIRTYYEYPINYHTDEHFMLVDLPCNSEFHGKFDENRDQSKTKFPLDLYIGLSINLEGQAYRLLNIIIDYNDIRNINIEEELLPIRIEDFEINLKEASRLELLPETIDNIHIGIKNNPTWQGILSILKKEISEKVTITDNLFLALSNKSIELSQLYSELNNQNMKNALDCSKPHKHSLLESFLLNEAIDNEVDSIDVDSLLCITQLDDSQKEAVANALNSRISVITGAPGTGKTQVIENILANALIQGKKVLVASKNNKAVDNVKDRFDQVVSSDYFLRFGSRSIVSNKTIPALERITSHIEKSQSSTDEYHWYKNKYDCTVCSLQKEKKEEASLIEQLKLSQQELHNIATKKNKFQIENKHIESEHRNNIDNLNRKYSNLLSFASIPEHELNRCLRAIRTLENDFTAKFKGIFGFWHRRFSVRKCISLYFKEVVSFPETLQLYFTSKNPIPNKISHPTLLELTLKWRKLITECITFIQELKEENTKYTHAKQCIERKINSLNDKEQQETIKFSNLNKSLADINSTISNGKRWISENSLKILLSCIQHHIQQKEARPITTTYKDYLPNKIPWKENDYKLFVQRAKEFIDTFNLCSVTSLSTKNAFPLESELFDMVIIDEASQCDIASALPLIMRTKQLVVIGDPMQLRHISSVTTEEEQMIKDKLELEDSQYIKYAECSLYDYSNDLISHAQSGSSIPYMLKYHYRCHPHIIEYSNDMFYGGRMKRRLEIKTDTNRLKGTPQGVVLVDVVGTQINDNVNINEAEAKKSIELAERVALSQPDVSIGIVTPFRHQAEKINSMIPTELRERIEANTVHKYQGDEKDIMIYSLVVTHNSPSKKIYWIDNIVPNLVNVAVTRAKSTLYVVGNFDYIMTHSNIDKPLGYLVRYKNKRISRL